MLRSFLALLLVGAVASEADGPRGYDTFSVRCISKPSQRTMSQDPFSLMMDRLSERYRIGCEVPEPSSGKFEFCSMAAVRLGEKPT